MSRTTHRSGQARIDYYPTPLWCTHRLIEAVDLPGGRWLEPAVGDGAIVRAVNELRSDVQWTTIDIRRECEPDLVADFTWMGCPEIEGSFDVIITNPPFSSALDFVRTALDRAPIVVMLLRLNWLGGGTRARRPAFLREHMPDVYVLPNRPSFDGEGTDATEYAWMVWDARRESRWGVVRVLEETPRLERRSA